MKNCVLMNGALALLLGACGDDGAPAGSTTNATAMTATNPTSSGETGEEDSSGTSNDPSMSSNAEDPSETTDEPESTTSTTMPPTTDESSGSGSETGSGLGSIRGAVIRSVEPAAGNDAIGNLYVGLLAECQQDAASVGDGAQVMDADFSAPGATVMYEIPDVPDGTYYVVAFLDDNGNSTPDSGPDMGDLVTAEGLGPGCVEVTVAGAASVVAPEAVDLNFLYPF